MKTNVCRSVIAILIVLSVLMGSFVLNPQQVVAAGTTYTDGVTGLTYELLPQGAKITGFRAPAGFNGNLNIPGQLQNAPVFFIGNGTFAKNLQIKAVTIPNSVFYVGFDAFYNCTNLASLTLPNSLITLGETAFYNCTSLTNLTIPATLQSMGDGVFMNCSNLSNITLSAGLRVIGNEMFFGCGRLSNILIPNSVGTMGAGAFASCQSLSSVGLVSGIKSMGSGAFINCSSLRQITVPDTVTAIGSYSFTGCPNLSEVNFLGRVTTLDQSAFLRAATDVTINFNVPSGSASYYSGKITSAVVGQTKNYYITDLLDSTSKVTSFTVKPLAYNSLKLTWKAVAGAKNYEIYRSTSATGTYTSVATVSQNTYTDKKSLIAGKAYYYKIRVFTLAGNVKKYGPYTAPVKCIPIPAVPASFKAAHYKTSSVKISWKKVTGASGYSIYRATSAKGSYKLIKNQTKLLYTNVGLTSGKYYYYKVRAYRTVNGKKIYSAFTTIKKVRA